MKYLTCKKEKFDSKYGKMLLIMNYYDVNYQNKP